MGRPPSPAPPPGKSEGGGGGGKPWIGRRGPAAGCPAPQAGLLIGQDRTQPSTHRIPPARVALIVAVWRRGAGPCAGANRARLRELRTLPRPRGGGPHLWVRWYKGCGTKAVVQRLGAAITDSIKKRSAEDVRWACGWAVKRPKRDGIEHVPLSTGDGTRGGEALPPVPCLRASPHRWRRRRRQCPHCPCQPSGC